MDGFNFGDFTKVLAEGTAEETGVSYEGKAKNWGTKDEAKDLIEAIINCKKLQYLNLAGNTLGVGAADGIADALKQHPEFKKALFRDLFTGRLKTEIPQALESLGQGMILAAAQLTVLDCSDNALGPNGMVGLVNLLKSPTCYSLQELQLNNCGLGIGGGKMLAKALADCHASSVKAGKPLKLRVFIAGRNRLENEGAKALAPVFGTIQTLEEVAMPQNGIYHVGISALADGFKNNVSMKVLNLNDNTITAKGAAALADALEYMQKLKEINFGDCLLKTAGAVYLAEALQDGHTELEVLNLGFNEIGSDGGLSVASAMQNKCNLKSLILNGNQFGEKGRLEISDELSASNRLNALGELDEDDSDGEEDEVEDDDDDDDDQEGEETDFENEDDDEDDDEDYAESDTEEIGDEISYGSNNKTNESFSFNNLSKLNNLNDSSICYEGELARPNTVQTFCDTPNPSLEMFNALEESDKIAAFKTYLQTLTDEEYLLNLIFAILKCSALSQQSNDALEVAQSLYKECFEYADKTNQMRRVKNFFLMQLGLLKNEDKTFRPAYNLEACRLALKHAIKLSSFQKDVSSTFELFLNVVK